MDNAQGRKAPVDRPCATLQQRMRFLRGLRFHGVEEEIDVVILSCSDGEYFKTGHCSLVRQPDGGVQNHRLSVWYRQLRRSRVSKTIHPTIRQQSTSNQLSDRREKNSIGKKNSIAFIMQNFIFLLLVEDDSCRLATTLLNTKR